MSHGLVPSKSTVYISNLPFDLSNNDLHKVFEKHGKIVKVTIVKDNVYRKSRGVAFIYFLKIEDAKKCVAAVDSKEMFGRTLKASIAKDNGRSTEFIKRKDYPDKTKCYECGEEGHLSYKCSKNILGERQPPPKKVKKKKDPQEAVKISKAIESYHDSDDDLLDETQNDEEIDDCETLSAAIAVEQEKTDLENYRLAVATGQYEKINKSKQDSRKRITKSSYFSDEEEID